jgi:hypothetical protein
MAIDRSIAIEGMMSGTIEADELLMLVTAHPIRLVSCMLHMGSDDKVCLLDACKILGLGLH